MDGSHGKNQRKLKSLRLPPLSAHPDRSVTSPSAKTSLTKLEISFVPSPNPCFHLHRWTLPPPHPIPSLPRRVPSALALSRHKRTKEGSGLVALPLSQYSHPCRPECRGLGPKSPPHSKVKNWLTSGPKTIGGPSSPHPHGRPLGCPSLD
ncbi:unnamed protein product [Pleuronectes platessa]|uniref:Uncharacterized protein n=1 Tax=Pleuronectes platessa TaxID=8262 RepID=A0A9N7ULI7_PLEPL|nr:unnamed protein product [Pleuronectes platessa]